MENRLKIIRKHLRLTQIEFAESLKISREYIASIEIGRAEISKKLALKIESKYSIYFNWILTGKGDMFLSSADELAYKKENQITHIKYCPFCGNNLEKLIA